MATTPERPTLALIDASNYLYRAFYAIRGLSGPGGRPTNAVLGFLNMWRKYVADRKPAGVAVCFDRYEKTFREEMDATYKAQRQAMPDDLVPQIEDAKRLCRLLGLAVLEEPGFEADDLIGSIACRAHDSGFRAEICSADKDLFQLVADPDVAVYHPVKDVLLDEAGVLEFFGVKPSQVIDVLALMGDSSNNIPGIRGIGEKTAKELIATFGSLDGIYERLDEVKGKKKELLAAGREDALRSRTLATVRCDRPLPAAPEDLLEYLRIRPLEGQAVQDLAAFYDEMGFAKVKKELLESGLPTKAAQPGKAAASSAPTTLSLFEESSSSNPHSEGVRWIADAAGLDALVAAAVKAGRAAVHVSAARAVRGRPRRSRLRSRSRAASRRRFPSTRAGRGRSRRSSRRCPSSPTTPSVSSSRRTRSGSPRPRGSSTRCLRATSWRPASMRTTSRGTRAASWTCRPSRSRPRRTWAAEPISGATVATDDGRRYLAPRVGEADALVDALAPHLSEGSPLGRVLVTIELPLVPVLARMEKAGVAVDRGVLLGLSKEFDARLAALETKIHEAAGEAFNIGSPLQLGRILFEKLAYPATKKTAKTKSYATGSDVLEELAALATGPVPALVLEWREISKLKGTYVDALPACIAADGRIHTRYDQAVAATGRLSSNAPNLQNIPVRTEAGRSIRRAFVAPAGAKLVAADYSQIELRLLAHLSGDEALIEVFRRGEDIHRATAAKIFGLAPGAVTADQRRSAKTINFGVLYGMGPFALAAQLGVPRAEAKEFIAAYFDRFPKIRACLDAILEKARATGGTETIFGRVRPIPGLADRNFNVRSNAERMAMNAPFQGSAADLIKIAMLALDAALAKELPEVRLLLQVHDELVLEAPAALAERAAALARRTMEGAASLSVPLTVEVGTGSNWAEAK